MKYWFIFLAIVFVIIGYTMVSLIMDLIRNPP